MFRLYAHLGAHVSPTGGAMFIFEILILCFAVSILTGYCIRVASEDQPKFDPNSKARFINGKWRIK